MINKLSSEIHIHTNFIKVHFSFYLGTLTNILNILKLFYSKSIGFLVFIFERIKI